MPKKFGFLYERVISQENCEGAEKDVARTHPGRRVCAKIRLEPEKIALGLSEDISAEAWVKEPVRRFDMYDSLREKVRNITVPSLKSQAVHHAVMRVTAPYLERRNYFYNCGCMPGAGQMRATRALRRWLAKRKIVKYGAVLDIKKFYDNCPHWAVMKALSRIFKDKRFLRLHALILKTMSDKVNAKGEKVGLAIGFYPSPWYANLVLAEIDRIIKEVYKGCKYVRYVDDMGIVGNNKRKLHKVIQTVARALTRVGLTLKSTWQVFIIRLRGLPFLSYRFFNGFTILRKKLMYRIAHALAYTPKRPTARQAAGAVSRVGVLKHCDSYNFRRDWVYPVISIKKMRGIISNEARTVRGAA